MRRALRLQILSMLVTACLGLESGAAQASGQTRVYYIAAEEVNWNYAPAGRDLMMGMPFDETQMAYVERRDDRIGTSYKKALYVEFTDASFTRRKQRSAGEAYLGL